MARPIPDQSGTPDSLPATDAENLGNQIKVSESTLSPENRTIGSIEQALSVVEALEWDAEKIIRNAARITRLKQGAKPYDPSKLQRQGKAWKTNLNTGAYATVLARVAPRLYMPLKNATSLVGATLPGSVQNNEEKSKFYQECVTSAIRSWSKWNWFLTGMAKEVCDYGYAFAVWADPIEWRPHLVRLDRGFVARGTEIMDENMPFFSMRWDYKPDELIQAARVAIDAGVGNWNKEAVAKAVFWATSPSAAATPPTEWRKWEELVREQVWNTTYRKGYRVIEATHLFVVEPTGLVSQYLLWKDSPTEDAKVLFERHDQYESMGHVVCPVVFGWGDGTIHGSWGAGHLLFDLARQLEKVRCDMLDNLRNANKTRLQVNDPKDINDVKQVVNDTEIILSGAQFANNLGGVQQNVDAYITLNNFMTEFMETKVGAYIPPIPTNSSDVKAAQVNAALSKEQEANKDAIETHLSQMSKVIKEMTRRLLLPESTDPAAVALKKKLLTKLNEEEIAQLSGQPVVESILDFTPMVAQSRAQFAMSVIGNPQYDQKRLARLVAEGVPGGGSKFADYVLVKEDDATLVTVQQRQQTLENTTLALGQQVPVVTTDDHWVHMQTMKSELVKAIQSGMVQAAAAGLKHYADHWTAGVALKTIPPEAINAEKSFIAEAEKAIGEMAQAEQRASMEQGAAQPELQA